MIYLDNAATTMHKPAQVRRAVSEALHRGGNAGRGGHSGEAYSDRVLFECRDEIATLFGLAEPERVVFTMNATHALNIAINSLVRPGMRVLISGYEHNAVRRPLLAKERAGEIETVVLRSPLFEPEVFLYKLEAELRRGAGLVVMTHVSNVFGYILPVERADELCAEHGVPLIVDASQSAGVLELNAAALRATRYLCMPGHKGLYGPQGTGALVCVGDRYEEEPPEPLMFGGTGGDSRAEGMPDYLPERVEAGTQNVHGIAGLREGVRFVRRTGTARILAHEREMARRIISGLALYPRVRVFAAPGLFCQTGVLSLVVRGVSCERTAELLAAEGIAVRAGQHCAPLAHDSAGTGREGSVRLSPSVFTKPSEADAAVRALARIAQREPL